MTDELRQVAAKTVALIPSKIPTLQIELGSAGPEAAIGGIVNSLHLAGISGQRLDIDPGRPKVPEFGRKIYHLKAFPASRRRKAATEFNQPIAIDRKLEALAFSAQTNGELADWKRAYQSFIKMLTSKRYGALICDYDGTLCDPSERFSDPRMEILNLLNEMLAKSVLIGIVSGRGTSIRRVFQKGLKRSFWNRVTIGYYNGADIATLDDDSHPNNRPRAGRSLLSLSRILHADSQLVRFADIESREKQISVRPHFEWQSHFCWESVQTAIAQQKVRGIRALRSSHSIDVIAPGVSKRNLVEQVRSQIDDDSLQILCIGDKGRWPGNDSEFLLEPTSLSVDEVSSAPGTCWNLASPGKRHVDATVEYLSKMDMSDGFFSFHVQPKEKP